MQTTQQTPRISYKKALEIVEEIRELCKRHEMELIGIEKLPEEDKLGSITFQFTLHFI